MMNFPSIDSLVEKIDSKYTLVTLVAMRARELTEYAAVSGDYLKEKPVTEALEEIYEESITYHIRK